MSAQPCGCDTEAKWTCERHREEERPMSVEQRARELIEHLEWAEQDGPFMWDSGNFRWSAAVVREMLAEIERLR